jgi:hypothetical protein
VECSASPPPLSNYRITTALPPRTYARSHRGAAPKLKGKAEAHKESGGAASALGWSTGEQRGAALFLWGPRSGACAVAEEHLR